MERIGIVSNDPHLKNELTSWLTEIPVEFEFVDLSSPAAADTSVAASEAASGDDGEPKPEEKKLRLVIFDSRTSVALSRLREDLKMTDVPWLAIGIEEHAHDPHAAMIRGANDLILLPLDRSVLLQKVEYILANGAALTPSFLFLAKAELPIELAKQVHVTHVSETGCTIQAPRPLARGVEGTLVCKIFGDGALERVEIRAVDSTPIFDSSMASLPAATVGAAEKSNFEVRLRFFGLKHKQLQNVRRWMAAHLPEGHKPPEIKRSDGEPKSVLHVALITPQQALGSLLASSLEQLAKIEIDGFGGFQRFHAALTKRAPAVVAVTTEALAESAFLTWSKHFVGPKTPDEAAPILPRSPMILHLRVPTDVFPGTFEKIAPALKPGEKLFSLPATVWSQDMAPLFKFFSDADRGALQEAIAWTTSNSTLTQKPETSLTLELIVSDTKRQRLVFKISQAEATTPAKAALLKLQVSEAPEISETPISDSTSPGQKSCEAVMVDASLLSFDLASKLAALNEWLEKFDIRNSFGNRPPIIVFNGNEEKIQTAEFRGTAVRQLAYEFADRRFQAEMFISLSRPELWTSPQLSVAGLKTDLKAFLGRPSKASAVSEVSLTVTDRTPLKIGTELLVMSPIWSQAPEGLWARLRAVSPKEGSFDNEFIFFGVSDLVQKEIRKFARADYIKKKAQGQG
ncbi:hypothetical protein BH10BDE1_BH10BDE1_13230 [soil metagenome]